MSKSGSDRDWEDYHAIYCEGCGQLYEASETLLEAVEEPVHRVDLIEAIGEFEEVSETTASEEHRCEDCGAWVVKRYYAYPASAIPEPDPEMIPDPEEHPDLFFGRDPDEDALIDARDIDRGIQEANEFLGIERETAALSDTETERS